MLYSLFLCAYSVYAITPPPSISNSNLRVGRVRLPESHWTKDTNIEIDGTVRLTGNRQVRGLWMNEENSPDLRLNGYLLTVGDGGINGYFKESNIYVRQGAITASGASLVIQTDTAGSSVFTREGEKVWRNLHIESEIRDNKGNKVGIIVKGPHSAGRLGLVRLMGTRSNTFTGDVVVEGVRNTLFLAKTNGATAIASKAIYVKAGGRLAIGQSDQIIDSATVTLIGNNSKLSFTGVSGPSDVTPVSEKIHALVVESGNGIFDFIHSNKFKDRSPKTIFLDDLIIKDGASLRIMNWEAGRDHFLVRKNSTHLAAAMKKLSIVGWGKNQVYLKSYNKDYWSIEAAPEPGTCGAILGAVGLGLWRWRRRGQ